MDAGVLRATMLRVNSIARSLKMANVEAYGIFPQTESPAAMPIMSCSAMPALKNRSGNAALK